MATDVDAHRLVVHLLGPHTRRERAYQRLYGALVWCAYRPLRIPRDRYGWTLDDKPNEWRPPWGPLRAIENVGIWCMDRKTHSINRRIR